MNLSDWLNRIQLLHVTDMDLSLERVKEVAARLDLLMPPCPVVMVAGTNGKGSCVAGLEAIYIAEGFRVGAFTSPILFCHNEYVRIQRHNVVDEQFCMAFERIDAARGDISLTPFEFNALAAFDIFHNANLDVWILEVGLGGRFDATNVIAADVAIVTSIGIDHVEWLGDTREKIAYEKAGIFRKNKPAVCGDFNPPQTLIDYANEIGAPLFCQNEHFGFKKIESNWNWWSRENRFENLPLPKLAIQNMSTVLMAIELLQKKLPVSQDTIRKVLANVTLTGRIQVFPGEIFRIFDLSHNPASAEFLAKWLQENVCYGKTRAVFSMLGDKDILATIDVIKNWIDEWHSAPLPVKRGATQEKLQNSFQQAGISHVIMHNSVKQAYESVNQLSKPNDRIVVFGSFHTVAEVLILQP